MMKPNKKLSREIAESISIEDITQMFENAKIGIKDWTKISVVNKSMTKGAAFNILSGITEKTHVMGKANAIKEFGEWLPIHVLDKYKAEPRTIKPHYIHHEEPRI